MQTTTDELNGQYWREQCTKARIGEDAARVEVYALRDVIKGLEKDLREARQIGQIKPEPEPVKLVPLGPEDVPPGSAIRYEGDPRPEWVSVLNVHANGVLCMNDHSEVIQLTWRRLFQNSSILRPGGEWQPCSKPSYGTMHDLGDGRYDWVPNKPA